MALETHRLPLVQLIKEQPPKDRLPLALNRKLGSQDIAPPKPTEPPKPIEPPKPVRPDERFVAGCVGVSVKPSVSVAQCHYDKHTSQLVSRCVPVSTSPMQMIGRCMGVFGLPFYPLVSCQSTQTTQAIALANCGRLWQDGVSALTDCIFLPTTTTVHYKGCVAVFDNTRRHFVQCQSHSTTQTVHYQDCTSIKYHGKHRSSCQSHVTQRAYPVPCRFYPIPPPPIPPKPNVCQIRPPSDRLPLALRRKSLSVLDLTADSLPLPLTCWHDTPPQTTPNKRSYIVHNIITASIAGLQIDPLSFGIKTDMDSFCWQGQVEITDKDYKRIKAKLDTQRGDEPLITVAINNHPFVIICEDISKNRSFVNHSYTLSGRSVTAHLSKDYANVVKFDNELYASQIVHDALRDLPITADFGVDDWLTHATMTDTPIAIIDTVATACGAFVMSDKAEGKLYIRPRYKVPVWELATTTPDRIIPLDVIKSISEQKRTNPRYNAVILTSQSDGAVVYRNEEGQDKHAPISNHELYTDQACIIPAGIAILSDSGTHQTANITLRWADKYNLPLATLGEIWQINDKVGNTDDAWRGIVQAITIDVKVDDGVPTVWQTVELDRYLDK